MAETSAGRQHELGFALLVTAAFAVWVAIGLYHHEMWSDELQAWTLARSSPDLETLLDYLQYEGHPALWYLPLWVMTRFTGNPVAMQVLHGVIATASVFLIALYGPFPRYQRVLIAFGYFFGWEYAIISRSYALGILLLLSALVLLGGRRPSLILIGGIMGLLANTSVYGAILALALGGAILVEMRLRFRNPPGPRSGADAEVARRSGDPSGGLRPKGSKATRDALLGALLFAAGLTVSVQTMRPPGDAAMEGVAPASREASETFQGESPLASPVSLQWVAAETLTVGVKTLVPLPRFRETGLPGWNSNLFNPDTSRGLAVGSGLTLLLFGIIAVGLLRAPAALAFFLLGTLGFFLFFALWHFGVLRHHGHLFVTMVAALWLARTMATTVVLPGRLDRWVSDSSRVGAALFAGILVVHAAVSGLFFVTDLRVTFGGGEAVADFFESTGRGEVSITTYRYPPSAVSAFLDRPAYHLHTREWAMAADRRLPRSALLNAREEKAELEALAGRLGEVHLVTQWEIADSVPALDFTEEYRVGPSLVGRESFVVYRVRPRLPLVPPER